VTLAITSLGVEPAHAQNQLPRELTPPKCDGATDDTAAFAAGNANLTIPPGSCVVASNVTLAGVITFAKGAVLKPSAGVTITLNAHIQAPLSQIFNISAPGSLVTGAATTSLKGIPPQWWGAVPDDATDDTAAIRASFAFAEQARAPWWLPTGIYKATSPLTFDFLPVATTGLALMGDGMQKSIIDAQSVAASPAIQFIGSGGTVGAPTSITYPQIVDLGVWCAHAGDCVSVGTVNFADAINEPVLRLAVVNGAASVLAVGVRLNFVLNADAFLVSNTGSGGVGLELDQTQFSTIKGSFGPVAGISVHITGGFNTGNVFSSLDMENVVDCVIADSATSEGNTFIGGTWNYTAHGVNATAGSGLYIINPQPNPGGSATLASFVSGSTGVVMRSPLFMVKAPRFPASGAPVTNSTGQPVQVEWEGGAITTRTINGVTVQVEGAGGVVINPGDTIALTYTGSPSWFWRALD
jgi:hypothetical protein